jgi:hypothetical protein
VACAALCINAIAYAYQCNLRAYNVIWHPATHGFRLASRSSNSNHVCAAQDVSFQPLPTTPWTLLSIVCAAFAVDVCGFHLSWKLSHLLLSVDCVADNVVPSAPRLGEAKGRRVWISILSLAASCHVCARFSLSRPLLCRGLAPLSRWRAAPQTTTTTMEWCLMSSICLISARVRGLPDDALSLSPQTSTLYPHSPLAGLVSENSDDNSCASQPKFCYFAFASNIYSVSAFYL